MKKKKNSEASCQTRLGKVGGQAVIEGVMMKAGDRTVTTCRKEDGSLVVTDDGFKSVRSKYKILDLPIIRGVVNFVEMMILSFRTLSASADALGLEEEEKPFCRIGAFSPTFYWAVAKLNFATTSVFLFLSIFIFN